MRHLFVVSRHHLGLYEYVRERFAAEANVTVILDRRQGRDRRATRTPCPADRRAADRRTRTEVDAALRMESIQFVTVPSATDPPAQHDETTPGQPPMFADRTQRRRRDSATTRRA